MLESADSAGSCARSTRADRARRGSTSFWSFTFLGSGWMLFGLVPLLFMPRDARAQRWSFCSRWPLTSGIVASAKALAGRVRPCHAFTRGSDAPHRAADRSIVSERARRGELCVRCVHLRVQRRAGARAGGPGYADRALARRARRALSERRRGGAFVGAALGWAGARASTCRRRRFGRRRFRSRRAMSGCRPGTCRPGSRGARSTWPMEQIFTHWLENSSRGALPRTGWSRHMARRPWPSRVRGTSYRLRSPRRRTLCRRGRDWAARATCSCRRAGTPAR